MLDAPLAKAGRNGPTNHHPMRVKEPLSAYRLPGIVLALVLAGCSTNAGFGTPVSGPQPVGQYPAQGQQPGAVGTPGAPAPGMGAQFAAPSGTPSPTPTPVPNTLSIVGAALRLAYDGSAKDPVKAARLLELTFALQNTTQNAAKITTISSHVIPNPTAFPDATVSVTAPANQMSPVASLVLATPDDPAKYRTVFLSFLDGQKMIGSSKLDMPLEDTSFTALDEKHPKGALSIDGAEISPIDVGKNPSFECTFAVTNPGMLPASITEFDIQPPKGEAIRLLIPMVVPLRSASGFVSVVVPYNGKALPSGSYVITAQQNGLVLASTSAVLL
jgi:hypothetical protein